MSDQTPDWIDVGFKRFYPAAVTIGGVQLVAKVEKYQFQPGKLTGRPKTAP